MVLLLGLKNTAFPSERRCKGSKSAATFEGEASSTLDISLVEIMAVEEIVAAQLQPIGLVQDLPQNS